MASPKKSPSKKSAPPVDADSTEWRLSWPDLSPFGAALKIAHLPSGRKILVVRAFPEDGNALNPQVVKALRILGFEQHPHGAWFKHSTLVPKNSFNREFPGLTWIERSPSDVTIDLTRKPPRNSSLDDSPNSTPPSP